jgi:predicted nucleotidyltransferase
VSVRVWKIDRNAILARLSRWARELGRDENVLAVVLFGSIARGDHTAASDADVLIVLRASQLRFDERIPAFMPSGIGIGVDVFPYTLDETGMALEEGWGVARVALEEGTFLFKRERELEELFNSKLRIEKR